VSEHRRLAEQLRRVADHIAAYPDTEVEGKLEIRSPRPPSSEEIRLAEAELLNWPDFNRKTVTTLHINLGPSS
jgi:hypothetical protein